MSESDSEGDGLEAVRAGLRKRKIRLLCEVSPSRSEIDERLLRGDNPTLVERWLKKERGENIGCNAVRRYMKTVLLPSRAFRQTYYRAMHLQADQKVDALQELYNAVVVQMKRLSIGVQVEQVSQKISGVVGKEMDLLRLYLRDIIELEMDLGVRQRASTEGGDKVMGDQDLRSLLTRVVESSRKGETAPALNEKSSGASTGAGAAGKAPPAVGGEGGSQG